MFGGKLPPGQYAGPWKWCDCVAAVELRGREPSAVDDANKARDRLLSLDRTSANPAVPAAPRAQPDTAHQPSMFWKDDYKGEF